MILGDYQQQIGQSLSQGHSDLKLLQWLENIKDIRTQWKAGKLVYFSEHSAHQHIANMVSSKKTYRGKRKPKSQPSRLDNSKRIDNTTQVTPTTWTDGLVFRRSRRSQVPSFQPYKFIDNDTSKSTPNQPIVIQAPPEAPKLQDLRDVSHGYQDGCTDIYDQSYETGADSGHHSNVSSGNYSLDHKTSSFASYFGEVDAKVGS